MPTPSGSTSSTTRPFRRSRAVTRRASRGCGPRCWRWWRPTARPSPTTRWCSPMSSCPRATSPSRRRGGSSTARALSPAESRGPGRAGPGRAGARRAGPRHPPLQGDLPGREPALELGLDRQLVPELRAQAQLVLVVARLPPARHERVPRAALEVVDEVHAAPAGDLLEREHRAQEPVAVAPALELA